MGELFHSTILAQVFGIYLLISAILVVARAGFYREVLKNLRATDPWLTVSSSFSLLLGILIVDIHNTWVFEPRLGITILAWVILIKSLLWLAIPERMITWGRTVYSGSGLYIVALIVALYGIFLMAGGFYRFY